MGIVRYAKVVLFTPTTGSLVACVAGLAVGGVFLARHRVQETPVAATPQITKANAVVVEQKQVPAPAPVMVEPKAELRRVAARVSVPARHEGLFQGKISKDNVAMLKAMEAMPSRMVAKEQKFRDFLSDALPYVPFHLGLDVPLPQALDSVLALSTNPMAVRDGRYVMLSKIADDVGRGRNRAFLWIDVQTGVSIGGVFFYPSNGEPTPTLTLFSKQAKKDDPKMSQFPSAFQSDFVRWMADAGVPRVVTRYFVAASGRKTVLTHDENFCGAGAKEDECERLNEKAAEIDRAAGFFLGQMHYASNAKVIRTPTDGSEQ